jgi:hypothetical protein
LQIRENAIGLMRSNVKKVGLCHTGRGVSAFNLKTTLLSTCRGDSKSTLCSKKNPDYLFPWAP